MAKSLEKTMTKKKSVQSKDVPSTPEIELKILEAEFARVEQALKQKRAQLAPQSQKEREAFLDAFFLGDDLDDERAVRAAALLVDWGFGVNAGVGRESKEQLATGIASVLYLVAGSIAQTQRHFARLKERTGNADF
jgi:hypothetical protein